MCHLARGLPLLLAILPSCTLLPPPNPYPPQQLHTSPATTTVAGAIIQEGYGAYLKAIGGDETKPPALLRAKFREFELTPGLWQITICDYSILPTKPHWITTIPVFLEPGHFYKLGEIAPVLKDETDGEIFPTTSITYHR